MPSRRARISTILSDTLTVVLAAAPAVSCGGDVGGGLEEDPGFVPIACSGDGVADWLAGVNPVEPADYVELRQGPRVLSVTGSRCSGASDRATCEQAIAAFPTDGGFEFGYQAQIISRAELVVTRGDEVHLADTLPELHAFLGPIDTSSEAALIVATLGYDVPCRVGGSLPREGAFDVQAFTYPGCGGRTRYVLRVDAAGHANTLSEQVVAEPEPNCSVGRRPAGLRAPASKRRIDTVGDFLAAAARLEAASVPAFLTLRDELAAHAAPARLIRAAVRSARDEVRHARVVARLALHFGVKPARAVVERRPIRDLTSLAEENAVEGCVRETYGAVVAGWQGRKATDPRVRQAYRRIARDETRHAALAWEIADWAECRLNARGRARVAAARRRAVADLRRELSGTPDARLVSVAGLPDRAHAATLFDALERQLWS